MAHRRGRHFRAQGLQDAGEFAVAADVALQAFFDGHRLSKVEFDRLFALELELRGHAKHKKKDDNAYDLDRYSYSRTTAVIALVIGVLTVFLQIAVAIGVALYLQFIFNRHLYESYFELVVSPDKYDDAVRNSTETVESLAPV